jgi:hypothetical protein
MVHVELAAVFGGFLHGVLRLAFATDEKDLFLLAGEVAEENGGFVNLLEGFLKVDDMDAVAGFENEPLHTGVPAAGLVTEMSSGFDEFCELLLGHDNEGVRLLHKLQREACSAHEG